MNGKKIKIVKIGMRGIPANRALCGGWDTVVERISAGLVEHDLDVTVYNRRYIGKDGRQKISNYNGVNLVWVPTMLSKRFGAFFYSFLASVKAMFSDADVVHYYTAGLSLFGILPRMRGKKIVCSVDGLDWQRAKWGALAKKYIKLSERIAITLSDEIITDARVIQKYYQDNYGKNTSCILYGAPILKSEDPDWIGRYNLQPRKYLLFVGRLTPENNVHHLIEAFEKVRTDYKLVIVGDDPYHKAYVNSLKTTKDPRIIFTGYVYGKGYRELNCNAYLYVFPDEVGGTHPALIEAMGCGNCVIANDTPANMEVIGDAGIGYEGGKGARDLKEKIQKLIDSPQTVINYRRRAVERMSANYVWERSVRQHYELYVNTVKSKPPANPEKR